MLTIRWDTVIIIGVVGLSVAFLVFQALVRVGAARLIRSRILARRTDASGHPLHADVRREQIPTSGQLTLHHDDANAARHTPLRRKAR